MRTKKAVVIFGLGAPIELEGKLRNSDRFAKFLVNSKYKVKLVDPVDLATGKRKVSDIRGKVDLLVGISLGGIWVVEMALKHPEAKLIMLATFPGRSEETVLLNKLVKNMNQKWVLWGLDKAKALPTRWLVEWYRRINRIPPGSSPETKRHYLREMARNVDYFKEKTVEEARKVMEMTGKGENWRELKKLRNKTLILAGENDHFCPVAVAKKMQEKIAGSKLVVTKGGHFNVFDGQAERVTRRFVE